jgi:hypothetical protein
MSRRTRSIPVVTGVRDPAAKDALIALKEIAEATTGRTLPIIEPLAAPSGASAVDIAIIAKLNEVINRLQY